MVDEYILAEYDFEDGVGGPDPQGWTSVDNTAQLDTFFHVDNFSGLPGYAPLAGSQSMWCGLRPDPGSGVDPTPELPSTYALYQNVPNPFNPSTAIHYDVPEAGQRVTLQVFDVRGRLVKTLVRRGAIGRRQIGGVGRHRLARPAGGIRHLFLPDGRRPVRVNTENGASQVK